MKWMSASTECQSDRALSCGAGAFIATRHASLPFVLGVAMGAAQSLLILRYALSLMENIQYL